MASIVASASIEIQAPAAAVRDRFLDWTTWPALFPATIRGVRLAGSHDGVTSVVVDHRTEGSVQNVLRRLSPGEVELQEVKPRYDATFLYRFEETREGSRCTVLARVWPRGALALLAPFVHGLVRRRIRRFVLEPLRDAIEG